MAQNEVYKDFDEAWSDVNDQPIKVKIGGKTYELPSSAVSYTHLRAHET